MVFNSLKKGHKFELVVAKWLTQVTGVAFYRVPMSGAAATNQKLENWHGDVYSESPGWKDLIVECKSYKKAVSLGDINNPKSKFNEWIAQTEKEAGGKSWLLFFKSNHGSTFVLSNTHDHLTYALDNSLHKVFSSCTLVAKIREYLLFELP